MIQWYYADPQRQQHGPFSADEIRALAGNGTLGPTTLLWHAGESDWRPLSVHAAALGLSAGPPPLRTGRAPTAAVPAAPPPARGLSGCAISAIVLAVVAVVAVPIIAILAAIALPAYKDYTLRSKASAAIVEARTYQPQVIAFLDAQGHCPTNDDEGFLPAEQYAGQAVSSVVFGEFEGSNLCGLEATIDAPAEDDLHGYPIWLEYDSGSGTWECSSEIADKHLPVECRG